jgi:hypothetical protein
MTCASSCRAQRPNQPRTWCRACLLDDAMEMPRKATVAELAERIKADWRFYVQGEESCLPSTVSGS